MEVRLKEGGLAGLRNVLEEWVKLQRETVLNWKLSDCLWWYNERASVGSLAAAVWKAGGRALEEYQNEKGRLGRKYQGRSDLWFEIGQEQYTLEAKQAWLSAGRSARKDHEVIEWYLRQAEQDCQKVYALKGRQLAAVFLVPYIPLTQSDTAENSLSAWRDSLEKIEYVARASVFPSVTAPISKDDRCIYPGVALLMRSWKGGKAT